MRIIYGLLLTAVMCRSVVGDDSWGSTWYKPTLLDMVVMEFNETKNKPPGDVEKLLS